MFSFLAPWSRAALCSVLNIWFSGPETTEFSNRSCPGFVCETCLCRRATLAPRAAARRPLRGFTGVYGRMRGARPPPAPVLGSAQVSPSPGCSSVMPAFPSEVTVRRRSALDNDGEAGSGPGGLAELQRGVSAPSSLGEASHQQGPHVWRAYKSSPAWEPGFSALGFKLLLLCSKTLLSSMWCCLARPEENWPCTHVLIGPAPCQHVGTSPFILA